MTIGQIPTQQDAEVRHYQQRTSLDGVDYLLTFGYNERRGLWWLTIDSLDGVRVLTKQSIVCGVPLLGRAINGPPGVLIALSDSPDLTPPGLLELGGRVKLWYLDASEVA